MEEAQARRVAISRGAEFAGPFRREFHGALVGRDDVAILVSHLHGDIDEVFSIRTDFLAVGGQDKMVGLAGRADGLLSATEPSALYATTFSSPGSYTVSFHIRR